MPAPSREPGRARLFRTGHSQALRLPKGFRFPGDEVSIRREGVAVILEPLPPSRWPRGYWQRLAGLRLTYRIRHMRPRLAPRKTR